MKQLEYNLGATLDDDARAGAIGARLAEMLNLKRDREYPDRWKTAWGTKTNAGLARTVAVAFDEAHTRTDDVQP